LENEEAVEVNLKRSGLSRLNGRQRLRVQILCQQCPAQNTRLTAITLPPARHDRVQIGHIARSKRLDSRQLDLIFDFLNQIFLSFVIFAFFPPLDFAS
jgi:hypothetical protein